MARSKFRRLFWLSALVVLLGIGLLRNHFDISESV